ncbi:MAG: hypothetical protein M0025_00240, partial [Elusimicrobia bacterium]|nr:hypothetical protein [Elusimicrobiota bacterium]
GLTAWGSMSGGAVTEWDGVGVDNAYRSGGTIQRLYGVNVYNQSGGVYNYAIATNESAGANNYALYNSGGAKSYFAGEVGLGISAPSAKLDVVSTGTAVDVYAQIWRNGSGVIVGSMSATGVLEAVRFVGDGSALTGLAGGSAGPSVDLSTINATATTPYGGVNITTNVFVNGAARLAMEVVQAADTGITLTSSDFGKTITVNSSGAQTVTLPSVSAADIGATITVVKLGAGKVTIQAAASTYLADSTAGGTIYNTAVSPAYAAITLRLVTATQWMILGGEGAWIST